jgi:hypothetical protein
MNSADWWGGLGQTVVGLLGGGTVVALVQGWLNRGKNKVETESVTVKTAHELMQGMRSDIESLRARLATAEERLSVQDQRLSHSEGLLDAYRRRVEYLTAILRSNSITVEDWSAPR